MEAFPPDTSLTMNLLASRSEHANDFFRLGTADHGRTTKMPTLLFGQPKRQVACAAVTVLRLARGRQAESLLDSLVCFLLRHFCINS